MGKKKNLYTRFFLSLTMISVCCILVLAVVIFSLYRNISIDNVNKANQNVLLNAESVFTNYKEIVQNYTMDFYANPNINALMMSGDTSWSDQLYSALSQIRGALVVNTYMENAYIFGVDEPVAIFENLPLSPASKQELFSRMQSSRIIESPFLWQATLNNGAPKTLLTVFYNDRAFTGSEYRGAVALTVNLSKLQNNLFSQKEGESARYAVVNEDAKVLMHSVQASVPYDPGMLQKVAASAEKKGAFVWKGEGDPKLITYIYSEPDKLWFLSETPYKDSIRDISYARNVIVGLCLALIAAAAVSAKLISRRIYQPIGRLFGSIAHLSGNEAALKSSGDFEAVNVELETIGVRLEQLKKESDDSALMRWLLSPQGTEERPGRSGSETPMMRIGASEGAYCVGVMHMLEPDGTWGAEETAEEVIGRVQTVFAGLAEVLVFRPHQEAAVLILREQHNGSFGDYALFRSKWAEISAALPASPCRFAVGVSGAADDPGLLKEKYHEALDGLQYIKFHKEQTIIFADDTIHLNSGPVPEQALEPVLQAVRQPDQAGHIPQAVERLLEIACSYRAEPASIALSKLAYELNRTAAIQTDSRHSGLLEEYRKIGQLRSYGKLQNWIEACCYAALERIAEMSAVETRSIAGEAVSYIREHYSDPGLSLNTLAEKLSLSPAYLSRLITEEVGSSFPDFVNLIRLEQAQNLLISDLGLDIRTIAEKVGYNSSTYFTTQFKKRYGVTPSKWRMNHILHNQSSIS